MRVCPQEGRSENMPASELGRDDWWKRYKETVNNDREMKVRGHDRFNDNFFVQIDEEKFLIRMHGGVVEEIVPNPGINGEHSFGVEGSRSAWEEFVQEVPPAHNNEIIASDYRTAVRGEEGYLKLQGNMKKVFQNLRPFQRALELMRKTHDDEQ